MTNKEYLMQLYKIDELIESDLAEISRLRQMSTSLSSPGASESVTGSVASSETTYTRCIEKITALEAKINREIDRLVDLKSEARAAINRLGNVNEQLVLKWRYLECLTWEDVADRMGYERRYVLKLHDRAVSHIKIPVRGVIRH